MKDKQKEFDVIIVGSGTSGATIARELCKQKKKVLLLELGENIPLKETFSGIGAIANEVPVANKMKALRAITTGGSTALYFGVTKFPSLDHFSSLGIDLSKELAEVKKELPIAELPDELLAPQVTRLRQSATELGYSFKKNQLLVDQSKCTSGYSYEARWKAKPYVQEAIQDGATLINKAEVLKVIVENNQAIGVEYKLKKGFMGSEIRKVYGTKIIMAAGSLSSPKILRDSGIKDVVDRGFYCKPGFVMFGAVPGLKGKDNFLGSMSTEDDDGIEFGDGNMSNTLFKLLMISKFKLGHLFSHSKTITVGVALNDVMSGELLENGSYHKQLTDEEFKKLKKGEEAAVKILKNAGAKTIFKGDVVGGNPGGVIRIQDHLDSNLQTKFRNLYVCDASLLTEEMNVTPTVTLVCLGKYLARQLLLSL